jgi:hypothetical protein
MMMTSGHTETSDRSLRALLGVLGLLGASCLSLLGCPHRDANPVKSAVNAVSVPRGCEGPLAGDYVHAQTNKGFHYHGVDDGGTLTLTVLREGPDAGAPLEADPGNTRIVLTRSARGFLGATYATQLPESSAGDPARKPCAVQLPAELIACDDAGVTLRAQDKVWLGPGCEAPAVSPPQLWLEQRLLHAPAPAAPAR